MVCLVVNHFLSLSAVALAGAAVNNSRVVLAKKLGRYSIDTWSLLASFWGFQRTQSGHIWGGPNMSCWKGDALNIDLFGSTAFWGRIGEQNRHTCHWNEHHHTRQQCCLDCYLLNKRLLLFYRCYGRFLSRDGGWPHWKKISSADAKSSCEKSQRCHTVKLPSSLCFWRCDDLMLQSNFKRQAFYYCLPNFFIAHLRKKNLKSIHKHLQEKKSVNKAIFSTCV